MLSQALARCLEHHGGSVRCNAPVKRIIVAGNRVRGIELEDGERVAADIVVSGAHVQTTLLDLVDREILPAGLRPKLQALRTGDGIGMTLRCAVDELPEYLACSATMDDGRWTTDDSSPSAHRPTTRLYALRTTHYAPGSTAPCSSSARAWNIYRWPTRTRSKDGPHDTPPWWL